MVGTGFSVTIKLVSGGTCTCTSDQISLSAGTCTAIPYLDSYSWNGSREMIDYTGFGDKIRKNTPGFPAHSVDFSGGLDLSNAQQLAFWNSLSCSTPATRVLRIVDGGKTHTVRGYCTGVTGGSSVGGKSTFSSTIQSNILPKTC